ncbi:hypothetical protein HDU98_010820, partial [Podochytrium sp. JEL0797]
MDPDPLDSFDPNDAIASSVDYITPLADDPETPAFTFRALLLGCLFGIGLSLANSVWAFRTNASITTSGATFAVVGSYPLGLLWHKYVPHHKFWNPSKFSVKEHVLIYVITHASSVPYGMENVVSQAMPTLMNNSDITFFHALSFVFATQFMGFGFAGLCRRFLVKPKAMLWPTTFSTLAVFVAFHNIATGSASTRRDSVLIGPDSSETTHAEFVIEDTPLPDLGQLSRQISWSSTSDSLKKQTPIVDSQIESGQETFEPVYKTSRQAAFWFSFLGMYLYSFIPEFFFPVLQSISICSSSSFAGLKVGSLGFFNTISSSTNGVGLFSITLDWYYIQAGFLTTPWWAILCFAVGNIFLSWVATVLLFTSDTWGLSRVMSTDKINPVLNSVHLFNGNPNSTSHQLGSPVNPTFFYDATSNYALNQTAYEDVSPLHITPFFA